MIGSLTCLVAMILGCQLFYLLVERNIDFYNLGGNEASFVLFCAFAVSMIEEIVRYWGYRLLLKEHRERIDGIAFGTGYGGIIVIMIGVLPMVWEFSKLFEIYEMIDVLEFIIKSFFTPKEADLFMLIDDAGLLSVFVLMAILSIQIALSILVLYVIREKKIAFLLLLIFLHFGVDVITYLHMFDVIEKTTSGIIIFLLGILSLYFIVRSRTLFYNEWDNIEKALKELSNKSVPKG